MVDVLKDFAAKLRSAKQQDESRVTKAPKVHKDDGILRFDLTAQEAYTRWRAFGDNVGIFAWAGNKRIRFLNLSVAPTSAAKSAGELSFLKEQRVLHVGCANGTGVYSNLVQVAGKEAQSAGDFANGYLRNSATLQLSWKDPSVRV